MKVLHLISTLDVGGAEQNLFRLLGSMDRDAFENEVVCMTRPGPLAHKLEQLGIPVHSLKMKKGRPELKAVLKLRFMAGLFRPDVVQCWMYHANLLGLTLLRPESTVWNIRCSDMDLSLYGGMYRTTVKAGAFLSRLPAAVVSNSKAGMTVHAGLGYDPRKWAVIPNGFDTGVFKPDQDARSRMRKELGIPEHAFAIGMIGRLDPMKDHATFFAAAELFLESHPGACFVLAGRGVRPENPEIKKLMKRERAFRLLGERDDIPRILAALDTAASSSLSEGLPNAIGEAMSCGIPCVATDAGDTADLVDDTGIVVKIHSPGDLSAGWDRMARMTREERLNLGMQARTRITDHYSLEKMTRAYEGLYRDIIP